MYRETCANSRRRIRTHVAAGGSMPKCEKRRRAGVIFRIRARTVYLYLVRPPTCCGRHLSQLRQARLDEARKWRRLRSCAERSSQSWLTGFGVGAWGCWPLRAWEMNGSRRERFQCARRPRSLGTATPLHELPLRRVSGKRTRCGGWLVRDALAQSSDLKADHNGVRPLALKQESIA